MNPVQANDIFNLVNSSIGQKTAFIEMLADVFNTLLYANVSILEDEINENADDSECYESAVYELHNKVLDNSFGEIAWFTRKLEYFKRINYTDVSDEIFKMMYEIPENEFQSFIALHFKNEIYQELEQNMPAYNYYKKLCECFKP